jgi:hypothetical protein
MLLQYVKTKDALPKDTQIECPICYIASELAKYWKSSDKAKTETHIRQRIYKRSIIIYLLSWEQRSSKKLKKSKKSRKSKI